MQRDVTVSYRVPIVALSVLLFLLVGSIVVILAGRAGQRDASPCPVGEWDVLSYREFVRVDALGTEVTFHGGSGVVLRLRADGTGETDYGAGVSFSSVAPDGRSIRLVVAGPVRFAYTLAPAGDSISVRPAGADATSQLFIDGSAYGSRERFEPEDARSYKIECSPATLVQSDEHLSVGYRRR
jgi:hypothetical protein